MSDHSEPKVNVNSWLQEELYHTYLNNKKNVDESWKTVFEANGAANSAPPNGAVGATRASGNAVTPAVVGTSADQLVPLRGVAAKIAENMTQSLTVPTATSQRMVPVRVIEQQRQQLNEQRAAAGQSKISYTHLIGWAIVQALKDFPGLNHAYAEQNGELFRVVRNEINLGIAVDVKSKDGASSLMVPNIKNVGGIGFDRFLAAFDDVVARARTGKLQMPDFQGTTISLTNPGTVGTLGSVPRLVVGQGAIIATGAMDYPAEYRTSSRETIASLGISKVMMVTCTYDHRVIQGADSGRFLGKLEALLTGEGNFYGDIFNELKLPAPKLTAPGASLSAAALRSPQPASVTESDAVKEAAVAQLIEAYRERGHLVADLDPLGSTRPPQPELDPAAHGLTEADLDHRFVSQQNRTLREIIHHFHSTYSGKIACEYMYIYDPVQTEWVRDRMEADQQPLDTQTKTRILDRLLEAEEFEKFLQTRYIGKKRFSVEGGESTMVALDEILERAANGSVAECVIGMAHRGRLNVLANIGGTPFHQVFAWFDEAPDPSLNEFGTGDVKYHLGASGTRTSTHGKEITVSVAFNPSHLEAVNPVVEGMVRPKQDKLGDSNRERVIPILIHGDAAFAGQGVVFETLNLSQLEGYRTGGTLHIVINNQIGFTTPPTDGRSGPYSTDIARAIHAPIFHVNGDDPEAVFRVAQMAYDFRQRFKKDVVIDIICYRRLGHNEGDDPSFTQPVMYRAIKDHKSVRTLYSDSLLSSGLFSADQMKDRHKEFQARLTEGYDTAKTIPENYDFQSEHEPAPVFDGGLTAIDSAMAERVLTSLTMLPEGFHLHPKMQGFLGKRQKVLSGDEPLDWALGEAIAFGSLLQDGVSVRLSGQDSGRGTFTQRHLELYDAEDGHKYLPVQQLAANGSRFEVWNSSLSEYAVMGFEFGFSVSDPGTLVLWEAQFGDFVNGAQIIVDQFLSSAETKWGQPSGLVLLLPHGYEGMGPEHSSARIERFLQLCAENNLIVANCSTPAQYFHILRRQMKGAPGGEPVCKPLILFTPKSLLRHPRATSKLADLTSGAFHEVIDDAAALPAATVKRLLFCSGKVYYDLVAEREKMGAGDVGIIRVEQMYPFPQVALQDVLKRYPKAELYWVQEEPRNMGPWRFMRDNLMPMLDETKRSLHYAGRPERASPAVGRSHKHEEEQEMLIKAAFAIDVVNIRPKRDKVVRKKK
ncbi:MAG TPA: multifunctional oxoglutarate decarboxylase/oxoglutarate dehydrogenase thiamine pyrophosphate-binding subunit/dihydrolipoyllysine-residue succinyltransferase subunit [Bryobacteraceae bacterium]|nr:multifunctional oxoglutarate decarboxylase/oxoglutarate dehydrogenase thiamine pyrophosphate-binding subunit/dihydrolipoyllysine-residue succinyltransferase subunit [Bryobacteraceae bacterium]